MSVTLSFKVEFRPNLGELSGQPRTPLQNPRQVKKKGLDKAGRHRSGLPVELPIRHARRHHMAYKRNQAEWLRKNGYLKI